VLLAEKTFGIKNLSLLNLHFENIFSTC